MTEDKYMTRLDCSNYHVQQNSTLKWAFGLIVLVVLTFSVPLSCQSVNSLQRLSTSETKIQAHELKLNEHDDKFDRIDEKMDEIIEILIRLDQKVKSEEEKI